jgi:hypothetical protein
VDRRNNHFYFGYNMNSIFFDSSPYSGPNGREQPDFEPAVIGYDSEGRMKWWNRLYTEAKDTTGDGQIDVTYTSPPDQYIDGLDIDYSVPLEEGGNVVVVARCHGNNTSNFWWGNQIALRPGASAFQNRFTGTEGNIHINYIARLVADDGNILAGTYLAGFFRRIINGKGNWPTQTYPQPIHDGWANHNAGWPDLTTTRIEPNSLRVGPDGRVYVVGNGPRMVTTSNAFQKLPRRLGHNNPILNEGSAPWNNWVRAYEPYLDALAYSSALTGVWTYPDGNIDAEPQGAGNTVLRGVWPVSGGLLVVGQHSNGAGTSAGGNNIPTANVPEWGATAYTGITGIFGLLPFGEDRPQAAFSMEVTKGSVHLNAGPSSANAANFAWSFGDGSTASGVEAHHHYSQTGTYLLGLSVTTADGLTASTHRWVEITEVSESPIPAPPVHIRGNASGSPVLAFATRMGSTYRIQVSNTLHPDDWADLGDPLAGTGEEELFALPDHPPAGPIFYRVVITTDAPATGAQPATE